MLTLPHISDNGGNGLPYPIGSKAGSKLNLNLSLTTEKVGGHCFCDGQKWSHNKKTGKCDNLQSKPFIINGECEV